MLPRAIVALAVLGVGACTPDDELAILIEASPEELLTPDEPLAANASVARLGQEIDARRGERTALGQETGPGAPFRVAIEVAVEGSYAVHVDVRRGEAVWSATRCLAVNGIEHLALTLSAGVPPADADSDGWSAVGVEGCESYEGGLADCNDGDPLVHPFAYDACGNAVDEDCVAGDRDCSDIDRDGYGDEVDCDDEDPDVHPDAVEDCDLERDLDCDGEPACDADGDTFVQGVDCDDGDPAIHPGAPERCSDDADSDCSGDPSNGCVEEDQDGDGALAVEAGGDDCADCDPSIAPGATERCGDGIDQDCAGGDAPCPANDGDGDGAVDEAAGGTDCDDADPNVYPGAPEECGSADDQDCDGRPGACDSPDGDGDGWEENDDCNDGDAEVHPSAAETCNDVDDDCDGVVDEPANCLVLTDSVQNCGGCWVQCVGQCDVDECVCGDRPDCQPGETCCGHDCLDVATDANNCGGCGIGCGSHEVCVGGACTCGGGPPCPNGVECCEGVCGGLDFDPDNCGVCGLDCGSDVQCQFGLCVCPGADTGVNLLEDDDHCGRCETACETRCQGAFPCERCTDGECVSQE